MQLSSFVFALSLALSHIGSHLVNAHGYVQNLTVDGQVYQAWHPFDDPYVPTPPQLIARKVPGDGPVVDITDPSIACNKGGAAGAPLAANIQAGHKVTFTWNRWPDDHKGPVTTYMANCGGDCRNFDGSGKVWFKIHQAGLDAKGQWASDKLIANGLSWTVPVPEALKGGQYLIRHEILALHSTGAPQFYPHCSQLSVQSSGTSTPSSSELVSFPGAYAGARQAILGDIYDPVPTTWPISGPDVAALAGGKGGANDPDASTNVSTDGSSNSPSSPSNTQGGNTANSTSATKPTPSSKGSSGHCKLKNAPAAKVVARGLKRRWASRGFDPLVARASH